MILGILERVTCELATRKLCSTVVYMYVPDSYDCLKMPYSYLMP